MADRLDSCHSIQRVNNAKGWGCGSMLEDTPSICKSLSSIANTAARMKDGNEEREGGEEVERDRFRKEVRRQSF